MTMTNVSEERFRINDRVLPSIFSLVQRSGQSNKKSWAYKQLLPTQCTCERNYKITVKEGII